MDPNEQPLQIDMTQINPPDPEQPEPAHHRPHSIALSPTRQQPSKPIRPRRSNTMAHSWIGNANLRPIHPLETVCDMTLLETVRDVLDDLTPMSPRTLHKHAKSANSAIPTRRKYLKRQKRQRKLTYVEQFEDAVCQTLSIDKSNPHLRRRVSAIIQTVESQDVRYTFSICEIPHLHKSHSPSALLPHQ